MKKINVLAVFVFVILAFSIASLVNQTVRAGTAESLMVNQASSTTTTLLSSSTITLGGSVTDTATVSGVSGVVPTGPVYFYVSTDGGSTWTLFDTESLNAAGTATSISYAPSAAPAPGVSYEFYAVYGGDNNYLSSQSVGTAEPLTVNQASASVSTPTPTATPTPPTPTLTPAPTPTATPTPTSDSTATPSPTPSPTPLYLVLVAVIILAAIIILLLSVIAIKRSRRKPGEALTNPETPI